MIEILILSFVQGITEFLPISSSSHLILTNEFLNFKHSNLAIDVSMHIGSFFAVITYFYKDIFNFIKNKELFLKVFIASVPVMIIGFFLAETKLIESLRSMKVIGWTTLIFGILLFLSDNFKLDKKIDTDFSYKSAVIIGIYQIFSLIPGVSRSGIAITAARFLSFDRFDSAKIAFLLSIPTLGAVSIYGIKNLAISEDFNFSILNIICILLSFLFSLITIKFFLKYIKRFSLKIFVIYRIILGVIVLFFAYL
tara:strand:- start:2468 stop:3226 length:759 start_codon:yes stop_codon:yes gene_type:complete